MSFNSATAVKPWRHADNRRAFYAEMQLQFGHGCEAVETFGGCNGGDEYDTMLQFGHGGEAVETGRPCR